MSASESACFFAGAFIRAEGFILRCPLEIRCKWRRNKRYENRPRYFMRTRYLDACVEADYPSATSSVIIRLKPSIKSTVPQFE